MNSTRIALISSMPTENKFLPFHLELKKIAKKKYNIDIDLLKNGDFTFILKQNENQLYYKNKKFFPQNYDLVFVRMAIKAAHGGDNYVLREFLASGIPIINPPDKLVKTRDKLRTLQELAQEELPVTPTALVRSQENINSALEIIGEPPYIIKNCFGSGGQKVLQASKTSQVLAIFDYLWNIDRNQILLIQPYLGSKRAMDVRSIYFNHKYWCSIVRIAQEGEFRANVKTGAVTEVTELSDQEKKICEDAVKKTGLILAGIDFLRTPNGPVILEINGCPGFTGISKAYDKQNRNLLDELVSLLENYIRNN